MIEKKIISNAKKTDSFLKKYFNNEKNSLLIKPMKYGSLAGGKKIRSAVIINTGKIFNINPNKLMNICVAVECIHSYSLVHDDLPCMDNDKIRRGKAATHIKFGEATAVLAGNSLLTLAFQIIADKKYKIDSNSKIELINNLALCSGHTGIAGGQELDLKFEKKKKNLRQIIDMQRKKTGKLFNFCCLSAAIVAKKNKKIKSDFSTLGEEIGLLFQFADDFIDIKGTEKLAGKPINKDKKKGKSTLVSLIGYKEASKFANKLKKNILSKLSKHGKKAEDLTNTVEFILGRNF
jgi:farnesyl diphosphate synthase|tara:strand:- start:489 stop:1364 length:876 start_codon:yes stop_codon:yes gene_type:complete